MTYPRREPWRTWPHEQQIAYLQQRVRTEQTAAQRATDGWMRAVNRVHVLEIEKEGHQCQTNA